VSACEDVSSEDQSGPSREDLLHLVGYHQQWDSPENFTVIAVILHPEGSCSIRPFPQLIELDLDYSAVECPTLYN
jgi:hypothetical protein